MPIRVGLALGGGVVRGSAHLGALSALRAAGVPIDVVAGTSAGAIAAAGFCSGIDDDRLLRFNRRLNWWRIIRPTWPVKGMVSFRGLAELMIHDMGDLTFEGLKTPCVIAVTDLEAGRPCYICSGRMAPVVQASCSVPGAVAPVLLNGRWMGEGGMTDMLPAAVLREMGADYVIGVDVFQPRLWRFLGPLGFLIAGLEIALEHAGGGINLVDCLISPDLAGRSYLRFSRRDLYFELGRKAALAKLPQILSDLGLPAPVDMLLLNA